MRLALLYVVVSLGAALAALPVVAEQAVERVSVQDAIGTLPVDMSLCRQGGSTLETGVLGDVHWREPGPWGFGVRARVTVPPLAGGTLASYVDREFIRANVEFIQDPEVAVAAYAGEFRSRIVDRVVLTSRSATRKSNRMNSPRFVSWNLSWAKPIRTCFHCLGSRARAW